VAVVDLRAAGRPNMQHFRRMLWPGLGLLLICAAGVVGVRFFLSAPRLAEEAASQLSDALGAPVTVESVSTGLTGGTALGNLRLHEDVQTKPWLTVREIDSNVSLLDLWSKKTRQATVTLRGVEANLRFAADGALLTRLPFSEASSGDASGALARTLA